MALIAGALCSPLAYAFVESVRHPQSAGEGGRIILPFFAVFAYWTLAVVFNSRTVIINPNRVRVALTPFPIGNGESIPRAAIAHVYARHIVEHDPEDGREIENFFTMGVQTEKGRQIDIRAPFETANDALYAARDIVQILNQHPTERPLSARTVERLHHDPAYKRLVLIWFAISILAIAIGAAWELSA